jgi:hypothetical protein
VKICAIAVAISILLTGCSWFAPIEMNKTEAGRTTFRAAESPSESATTASEKLPGESR